LARPVEIREAALASGYTIFDGRALHYRHEAMGNAHFEALSADRTALAVTMAGCPVIRAIVLGRFIVKDATFDKRAIP
jgi:hypothetical protein